MNASQMKARFDNLQIYAVLHERRHRPLTEYNLCGEKKFFAKVSDKQIAVETGPDGRAARLAVYSGERQLMRAERVFDPA